MLAGTTFRLRSSPGGSRSPAREKLRATVVYGCIDIGSNTTRLLVADSTGQQMVAQRSFTRIGSSLDDDGRIPAEKIAEIAGVAGAQAQLARESGAGTLVAVGTAAVRDASNRDELVAAVERAAGVRLMVLDPSEEARLSFVGATRTLPAERRTQGTIAVIDVGGGSTEIAVGTHDGAVEWSRSVRVGSGLLADSHLHSDPPAPAELDAARDHVSGLFENLAPPAATTAVAVGGSATSLHRLVGDELNERTLAEGVRVLSGSRIEEAARRFDLDPERVRLLPAGIIVLSAASACLRVPLRIAQGGLREGVIHELVDGSGLEQA